MGPLVTTTWLAEALGAADLRILDATLVLPGAGRDAAGEYEEAHIAGAVFMDLDHLADLDSRLPHMLPAPHHFARAMERLGVSDTDRIVVYDNSPLHSAARAWWMLRAYGAKQVAVLDGGLPLWRAEGRPVEGGVPAPERGSFTALLDHGQVADKKYVRGVVTRCDHELVDARSAPRFAGEEPEPRAGVAPGHIPTSRNLPQGQLFAPDNRMKSPAELRAAFDAAGVDLARPMVATCGSGITAAVIALGAQLIGKDDVMIYDGSWSEWGADPALPKASGRA